MTWTEERVELLRKLHDEGLSFRLIAEEIGGGISRNACIGKAKRLGLTDAQPRRRDMAALTVWVKEPQRHQRPKPAPVFNLEPVVPKRMRLKEPASKGLSILDLTHATCKWPHGDGPYTFCGHVSVEGSPYCAYHEELARA